MPAATAKEHTAANLREHDVRSLFFNLYARVARYFTFSTQAHYRAWRKGAGGTAVPVIRLLNVEPWGC